MAVPKNTPTRYLKTHGLDIWLVGNTGHRRTMQVTPSLALDSTSDLKLNNDHPTFVLPFFNVEDRISSQQHVAYITANSVI